MLTIIVSFPASIILGILGIALDKNKSVAIASTGISISLVVVYFALVGYMTLCR